MSDNLIEMNESGIKKAYARWAPFYDYTFGKIADAGRVEAVRHINQLYGHVLEAGVGTGISLPQYAPHIRVTGIDLSPEMLEIARKRAMRLGLDNVEAIKEMDAGNMEFPDAHFDVVIAMYVMTVVPDPQKVMRELSRVCKPGGEVILVNHFSQEFGLRGLMEKTVARFGDKLGWRPHFPMETVLVCDDLEVMQTRHLRPFGMFTMMRFKKLAQAEISQEDARQPKVA